MSSTPQSNIVKLPGAEIPSHPEPMPEIVQVLEFLLSLAKTGELRYIVGAGRNSDGLPITFYSSQYSNFFEMLGIVRNIELEFLERHARSLKT